MSNNRVKITYSPRELQGALGLSRDATYRLIHTAGFPSIKVGGRYMVPIAALNDWLMKQADHEGVAI